MNTRMGAANFVSAARFGWATSLATCVACSAPNPLFGANATDSGSGRDDDATTNGSSGPTVPGDSGPTAGGNEGDGDGTTGGSAGEGSEDTSVSACVGARSCAAVPTGWKGPVVFDTFPAGISMPPCLDANYSVPLRSGAAGPLPSDVPCCSCTAQPATCGPVVRNVSATGCDNPIQPGLSDGATCAIESQVETFNLSFETSTKAPGECAAAAWPELVDPAFIGRICDAPACEDDAECFPPAETGTLCLYVDEPTEQACPVGWGDREEIYEPLAEECPATCECNSTGGAGCNVRIQRYSDMACETEMGVPSEWIGCNPAEDMMAAAHTAFAMPTDFDCNPSSNVSSAVTAAQIWTVCCQDG